MLPCLRSTLRFTFSLWTIVRLLYSNFLRTFYLFIYYWPKIIVSLITFPLNYFYLMMLLVNCTHQFVTFASDVRYAQQKVLNLLLISLQCCSTLWVIVSAKVLRNLLRMTKMNPSQREALTFAHSSLSPFLLPSPLSVRIEARFRFQLEN